MARLKENWSRLDKNQKGEVIRRTGDFATRKGQCLEPTSVVDLFPFTVTHKVNKIYRVNYKTMHCTEMMFYVILSLGTFICEIQMRII